LISINWPCLLQIVYVAPMKALATEMTRTFGARLASLDIRVRELTGDTRLTKAEVRATQMLIVTPEKWDVVTRKGSGDTELTEKVRLLIIDEVHLLHDDRGPVIETLVARTLRQVRLVYANNVRAYVFEYIGCATATVNTYCRLVGYTAQLYGRCHILER
jgi:replicative superfamily II helicase